MSNSNWESSKASIVFGVSTMDAFKSIPESSIEDSFIAIEAMRGVVKQVISGDAVVLLGPASTPNGIPQEITVYLANISAPRLARRPTDNAPGFSDEPFAWEAREFLRKKIVGQQVNFVRDFIATSGREHGRVFIGGTSMETAENVAETGVAEGWLEVRPGKQVDEQTQKLLDLQEKAKNQKKGKWAVDEADYQKHVRNIKWNFDDPRTLVDKYSQKPVQAVIESVRDGSIVRAFLLPDFEYVTIMLSGIEAPSAQSIVVQPFGEEAKFFVEQKILHRDVEVILESTSNQNFKGSVFHPRGNVAEFLLKEGYAKCVDWSIGFTTAGATTLRKAEKVAKDNKLRLWRNYIGSNEIDLSFQGTMRPKRNDFVAVLFSNQWHRARVEAIKGDTAEIYYIDSGNRQSIPVLKIAPLPARFHSVPHDAYYSKEDSSEFDELSFSQPSFLLNSEYKNGTIEAITLVTDDEKKRDIGKQLVSDGFALVEARREGRLKSLVEQNSAAKRPRLSMNQIRTTQDEILIHSPFTEARVPKLSSRVGINQNQHVAASSSSSNQILPRAHSSPNTTVHNMNFTFDADISAIPCSPKSLK